MRRWGAVVVVVGLVVVATAACGGGGSKPKAAPTGDLNTFCAAMQALSASDTANDSALEQAFTDAEANAPADIRADALTFVANARAVNAAVAAHGGASADINAVVASLTPEQQKFVADLAAANESSAAPDDATGRVITYVTMNCSRPSSKFSSVASSIN